MASINPYIAAGKFKLFDGNTDLVPGVSAISTYGHTPGHTVTWSKAKANDWCYGVT